MQLTQGYVSGDSTLVNDDSENSNGPATTTRRGIRKARSSGNIRNNMDYNNADRPVSRLTIDRIPYKTIHIYNNDQKNRWSHSTRPRKV